MIIDGLPCVMRLGMVSSFVIDWLSRDYLPRKCRSAIIHQHSSTHKHNSFHLGFGLPHTDENPYNSNLGNCLGEFIATLMNLSHWIIVSSLSLYYVRLLLDYTDDPESNVLPGDVNMNKLRSMYLSRRLRTVEEDGTVVERTELLLRWNTTRNVEKWYLWNACDGLSWISPKRIVWSGVRWLDSEIIMHFNNSAFFV